MIIYFLGLHFFNDPDVVPDLDGNPTDGQVSDAEKQRNSCRRKLKLLRADSRDVIYLLECRSMAPATRPSPEDSGSHICCQSPGGDSCLALVFLYW